jgi:hypothetical protein
VTRLATFLRPPGAGACSRLGLAVRFIDGFSGKCQNFFCSGKPDNPPGRLKMVVGYAHEEPDVILDALFQDLEVIAPFQYRNQPAFGGLLGQVQQ